VNGLALLGRQLSKRLVNSGTELGVFGRPVNRLNQRSIADGDGRLATPSPQCAEALVADGASQIAVFAVEARCCSTLADERQKHLLNGVRDARRISQQHQGVSIQPSGVPVIRAADPIGRWSVERPAPHHMIL
jgi:hypothetical protein